MKMNTPWGQADQTKHLGGGLVSVQTPSHGGIFVPVDVYRNMPEPLKCNVYGGGTWFEEDCEWALVALAFPQFFDARSLYYAVQTVAAYADKAPYASAAEWLATSAAGIRLAKDFDKLPAIGLPQVKPVQSELLELQLA